MHSRSSTPLTPTLGDFTTDRRVVLLMFLAAIVGVAGVGSAWVLLKLIALCTNIGYYGRFSFESVSIQGNTLGLGAVLIPVAGCLIIGLMARYGSEKIRGHGIPEAMEAILIGRSRIQPKVAILKPLSSAISIGTGGPFGAEGPIIMTGGALGSLLAQTMHMSSAERKTLLVAGAAAGMTAIFATPMAAILLAVELLLFEWKPRSFLPVTVAAIVAAAVRPLIMQTGPIFPYGGNFTFSSEHLIACAFIGVLAGLASGVLTTLVYAAEEMFEKLPVHWMWWPAIGGLVVGIGGLIEPAALGVGYDSISHLLAGDLTMRAVFILLVVKVIIWSIALGSGTSGGVLAPLLIFGGAIGALTTGFMPKADPGFWALLGMAAMMGGTMRAPLTSTLFALELTDNLHILLPVLTASAFAYGVTVLLLKRSILTEKLARRGHHITREYNVDPFVLTRVGSLMVSNVDTLPAHMTVRDAIAHFTTTARRHTAYPVVDEHGILIAKVTRADSLAWMVDDYNGDLTLAQALDGRELLVGYPDDLASKLADNMAVAGVGRVPIVERATGRLIGLIGRKDLLQLRAVRLSDEQERVAFFRKGNKTHGKRVARRLGKQRKRSE